jgi:drug/metabolite transporter (DMT)-like permease
MMASGWWECFAYVWVISILNLTYAAAIALGVHPTAFVLEAFFVGAISLLVIAKPGDNAVAIILAPQTWGYGLATIVAEIFYYLMIVIVPPADASLFMRLNILLTIFMGWLVFGRKIGSLRALGMIIVLVGFLITACFFPAARGAPFLATMFGTALFMSARNLLAEFHPWNRRAKTVTEKMRVTGIVVLATSCIGLAVTVALSLLVANDVLAPIRALPPLDQFLRPPTIILALITGCILITVMQYLMFSAVVKITSENFFAVMALVPLATLILQEAAARVGLVGAVPAGWHILPFMLLILIGNVLIVWRAGPTLGDELSRP